MRKAPPGAVAGSRDAPRELDAAELARAMAALPEPLSDAVRARGAFLLVCRTWRYYERLADEAESKAWRRAAIFAKTREKDTSGAHALAHELDLIALRRERDEARASARACTRLLLEIADGVEAALLRARRYRAWLAENDPEF